VFYLWGEVTVGWRKMVLVERIEAFTKTERERQTDNVFHHNCILLVSSCMAEKIDGILSLF